MTQDPYWQTHPFSYEYVRPSWDEYFVNIAIAVSARADCRRARHGAVVVDTNRIIVGTGYNGGPAGGASCLKGECPRGLLSYDQVAPLSSYDEGLGFCVAVHAESNALLHSTGPGVRGGTIYVTGKSCNGCRKLIQAAGIKRVVWPDGEEMF